MFQARVRRQIPPSLCKSRSFSMAIISRFAECAKCGAFIHRPNENRGFKEEDGRENGTRELGKETVAAVGGWLQGRWANRHL